MRILRTLLWLPFKLFGSLLFATVSEGQHSGIGGYVALDDHSELAERTKSWLYSQELPALPQDFAGGGGGSLQTRGRLIIEGGGSGAGADALAPTGEKVGAGVGQGHGNVGLILLRTRFFRVYPLVGMGGAGGGAGVTSGDGAKTETTPFWFAGSVHSGIGIDFTLTLGPIELFVGVRAGYQVNLGSVQFGGGDYFEPLEGTFVRGAAGLRIVRG